MSNNSEIVVTSSFIEDVERLLDTIAGDITTTREQVDLMERIQEVIDSL